jgi:hypothetical protein
MKFPIVKFLFSASCYFIPGAYAVDKVWLHTLGICNEKKQRREKERANNVAEGGHLLARPLTVPARPGK